MMEKRRANWRSLAVLSLNEVQGPSEANSINVHHCKKAVGNIFRNGPA
jgi:hypothetical protein